MTLKSSKLSKENLSVIFKELLKDEHTCPFTFELDSLIPIRKDDVYGGYSIKINACFDSLREVVFVDVTSGDVLTPKEIEYTLKSVFNDEAINILSYNLETVFAEKLETILKSGRTSTRPRDRYDLFVLWKLKKEEIDVNVLKEALLSTAIKRNSLPQIMSWQEELNHMENSDYQSQIWERYQHSFTYARQINYKTSIVIVKEIMSKLSFIEL